LGKAIVFAEGILILFMVRISLKVKVGKFNFELKGMVTNMGNIIKILVCLVGTALVG